MPSSHRKVVKIVQQAEQKKLTSAQKQFNTLIKTIDSYKKRLREWMDIVPQYKHKIVSEYDVLWDTYNTYRTELVHLLDRAHDDPLFKKTDKAKLKHLICTITYELIAEHEKDELKSLHNKYSQSDFDADQQEMEAALNDMMKTMLEDAFGVDVGDDIDCRSPEKIQALLQEKLQAENGGQRKKTAKQRKKDAEQQQEAQNLSQSIQEVFRKLAAALHPDREPDPQERERKTEIMQRVNVAYAKKDLLQLLELQLEVEQIDQEHLNNIAENRLKYFNKILKEQLTELQQEIAHIEFSFKHRLNLAPYQSLTPQGLMQHLAHDIEDVRRDIASIQQEINNFQNPAALKAWLKSYKIPKEQEPDMGELEDLLFSGLMPPFGFK